MSDQVQYAIKAKTIEELLHSLQMLKYPAIKNAIESGLPVFGEDRGYLGQTKQEKVCVSYDSTDMKYLKLLWAKLDNPNALAKEIISLSIERI